MYVLLAQLLGFSSCALAVLPTVIYTEPNNTTAKKVWFVEYFGCPSALSDNKVLVTFNKTETTMGVLDSLSFVTAKKQARNSPQQHRRNKLAAKIDEQVKLAQARMEGTT